MSPMRFEISHATFVIVMLSLGLSAGHCQPARTGLDILHYDFTLVLPDEGSFIQGRAVITALRYPSADRVTLDLVRLRVDTVLVDGHIGEFRRTEALIDISLGSRRAAATDTIVITICYSGEVTDGLIVNTDQQGRWSAFGDNWPDRARNWLPTVDDPSDKATVSWNIIAPTGRKVVANGLLVEETTIPSGPDGVSSARSITRWKTDRPIPSSLMVIAAGPLVKFDLGLTASGLTEFPPGVWQSVYVVPELQGYLPGPFAAASDIVAFFSRTIGPFPYEKLAHLQSRTRFGGMENASAIFYANNTFTQRRVSTGLIAHETAHQWFGDAVTPASWGHLWLSEGFASYFEQLWVEHDAGVAAFRNGMAQLRVEVLRSKVTGSRPVIDTLQTNLMHLLNTNSYQKGAWVLHMIRSMIGDSLFFEGVRSYYGLHRHGNATTDDLCEVFSRISGTDLRWFFDQWLRRPGVPELTVKANVDGQDQQVIIDVTQNQALASFRFPLRVELIDASGASRFATVEVPARPQVSLEVPFPRGFRPVKVLFDPNIELLASIRVR